MTVGHTDEMELRLSNAWRTLRLSIPDLADFADAVKDYCKSVKELLRPNNQLPPNNNSVQEQQLCSRFALNGRHIFIENLKNMMGSAVAPGDAAEIRRDVAGPVFGALSFNRRAPLLVATAALRPPY